MSREYRDLLVKAAPDGEELEEKAGRGRGLMPGRSGARSMWMRTFRQRMVLTGGTMSPAKIKRAKNRRRFASLEKIARRLSRSGSWMP